MVLDLLVSILGKGRSTEGITASGRESGVGQVFICINQPELELCNQIADHIVNYTKSSAPVNPGETVAYPGENTLRTRTQNLAEGIPVNETIWNKILAY